LAIGVLVLLEQGAVLGPCLVDANTLAVFVVAFADQGAVRGPTLLGAVSVAVAVDPLGRHLLASLAVPVLAFPALAILERLPLASLPVVAPGLAALGLALICDQPKDQHAFFVPLFAFTIDDDILLVLVPHQLHSLGQLAVVVEPLPKSIGPPVLEDDAASLLVPVTDQQAARKRFAIDLEYLICRHCLAKLLLADLVFGRASGHPQGQCQH